MIREQRLNRILVLIRQEKLVSIHELTYRLDVSYMTISRDLGELEAEGSLRRIRGRAMLIKKDVNLASPSFPLFDPQLDPHHLKKAAFGRYAARHLVQDGDHITIEAGSITSSMMQFLHQSNLTILTNGLLDSSKFGIRSLVQVLALGEVDTIVSGADNPPDIVTALKSKGIDIRIADECR